ncbi:hypothetical protein LOTGIDRAFT_51613, partial [Lottia gigantea]
KRCELSCKAEGHHYYRSLDAILSDGIPCKLDNNSYCLSGVCLSVGCDGILGSQAKRDSCGVCNGNGNSCQIISGIFTRSHLSKQGYNHITKIPRGACNINITEMAKSRNYLALKLTDGKYIINGNIQLRRTGSFKAAGTEFTYYKNTGPSCPGECIYSTGPTNNSIDVEVLYYHRNPGIIYQFTIPHEQVEELGLPSSRLNQQSVVSRTGQYIIPSAKSSYLTLTDTSNPYQPNPILQSHDRNLVDKSGLYSWRISGFTECSRSCGGGTQKTRVLCMKGTSNVEVTEENCDPSTRPQEQTVGCNNSPCPSAEWFIGNWTSCSVTCGVGKQNRLVECRRRISSTLEVSVSATLCLNTPKPTRTKRCSNSPCATWNAGNWSKCSAECGHGQRSRTVNCKDMNGKITDISQCDRQKPKTEEICDMGSCAEGWYHTRWSDECSAHCGRGFYTRKIFCAADDGSTLPDKRCPIAKKPKTKKTCKSDLPCGGNWFTGPWSKCNATCGHGVLERGVVCMKRLRSEVYTVVKDVNCLTDEKPESTKDCGELPPCQPTWYMTEYSQCTKSCDTGVKKREVKCLNADLQPDMTCNKRKRPATRQSCNKESFYFPVIPDDNCKDTYPDWCQFVHQARICGYKYYQKQCCKSC